MRAIVNQPPAGSMQPVEPTAMLGNPNFEPVLMSAPMRRW
jgi:hypothetical protein